MICFEPKNSEKKVPFFVKECLQKQICQQKNFNMKAWNPTDLPYKFTNFQNLLSEFAKQLTLFICLLGKIRACLVLGLFFDYYYFN